MSVVTNRKDLQERVHALVREGFRHEFGKPETGLIKDPEWQKIRNTGTRLWLDTGDMDEAVRIYTAEFEALTTNNTLLNAEVQKGIYDELITQAAATIREAVPDITDQELVLEVAFVLNARHGLRLVSVFDAKVSVELHTDLAHDVDRSVWYGQRFHAVCPERFIVKVPLTPAGLVSARRLSQQGIPVNFTLGFSARQNYLIALLAQPRFVNVFMGRLGAFVADHQLGTGAGIGEKATLATQRELLRLRREGQTQSYLIGASMRTGAQVAALAGLDVFTMPPKVAADYRRNPSEEVTLKINCDPEVPLAEGVSLQDLNAVSLWEISDNFRSCVERLVKTDIGSLSPEAIQAAFDAVGIGDFLPHWTEDEISTIKRDGKIPVYATWKDRLASGHLGLDALMNVSALYSFVTDQTALDNRIRGLVA